MILQNKFQTEDISQNLIITAIAVSTGDLDVLKKITAQIPEDSDMAFVIIPQLSSYPSAELVEAISQNAKIPVSEIISGIHFQPNTISIVPENNYLSAEDGILKMQHITRIDKITTPIDISFEALAKIYKEFSIGILLSGTSSDGTHGLKKIKEFGGTAIVQNPETAVHKTTVQNAIEADAVDFALTPENIIPHLTSIRKSYLYSDEMDIPKKEDGVLKQILNLILQKTGNDFLHYKKPTILRRINRRMVALKKENISDYYDILRNDKNEQELLANDLIIPVTYFFRDEDSFDSLSKTILPQLIENCTDNTLRIWTAACSTGEEAYSLAIIICEYFSQHNIKDIKVQIFASDISEKSIAKARSAVYSAQDVRDISETRLENYFTKREGHYHINKVIRDMCVFARHNFIKDPPFAKIDLVSCRNVMIYLDSFLQEKVLGSFHYSLKEKGFLFLGKSESANTASHLFETIVKQDKIYAKKFTPARYVPQPFKPIYNTINRQTAVQSGEEIDFRKIADDILFSKYTPASVIINEHLEIVHFHGDTSPFLLPAPGRPNFNVLKMAREGIGFELRNAISEIKKNRENILHENLTVKDQNYQASFEILTLSSDQDHLMILFHKCPLPETDLDAKPNKKNADQLRIAELEKELSQLRDDIKKVTEEQQIAFEELQTTNEELLSSSEELQALNEELQTSTEELQSNNQELMCTNDELLDRQEQLLSMRDYAESIVQTIREPLIIIDKDYTVKSANPAFYKYFGTTDKETEGFSFFEIGNSQWDIPDFKNLILQMAVQKQAIEDYKLQISCHETDKKTLMVNARLLQNAKQDGMVLLAFEDITDLLESNELLNNRNTELQVYNEQLENFTSAASHDLQEPLNKIYMLCERIFDKEKSLSENGKHNLQRAMYSVKNMSQLITDLINYSRISFNEKKSKKTDFTLLLKKTLNDIKDSIEEKEAVIELAIEENSIHAINFQIQQLLTNLILNSIKYSKEDVAPQIKIESVKATSEEITKLAGNPEIEYVKITVSDNGIGIGKDFENRIFEPFYRLHSKDEYSGSGLGLTLVKKIVSNHNGFIQVDSTVDVGTAVSIFLPS
ncbi:CheR family methyltransferase [Flavobacterium sp. DG2-3]|uniref:CheR family methyltransferase n=1 Tax=Flavobacterium sp. DG2-3 TaxID=3068317 RepID=UPI00273EE4CE|nr:CheR family methyltransferase [Flavobacterium sp. DG2-3]MDP5199066.1 CheR family methyltransferase [Flavobacterium sp. DG2-3]